MGEVRPPIGDNVGEVRPTRGDNVGEVRLPRGDHRHCLELHSMSDIAIPSFAKVNVNKVYIFYAIALIQLACCSFRCTHSLH